MIRKVLTSLLFLMFAATLFAQDKNQEYEEVAITQVASLYGKRVPKALLDPISVSFDGIPFNEALNTIAEKSNLKLNYIFEQLPTDQSITLHLDDVSALQVLLQTLEGSGTFIQFTNTGQLAILPMGEGMDGGSSGVAVSGVVVDASSGSVLPGANVYLVDTGLGSATNLEGEYTITNVPPGVYTIKFKYIGYQEFQKDIRVQYGQPLTVNAELSFAALEGDVVTVTAQAQGQMAAINQQLASSTIKNVVAADRIQEIPDVNAAESVGRLPGISIVRSGGEGQKVSIRGMSPKYNVMMVNGVRMQSTDRDDRSVDLNMISSNMLSGIEVTKALTADMDADAVGGTVNLRLKGADPGWHGKFMMQGGYGSIQNNYDNYKISGSLSNRFFKDMLGVVVTANMERVDRSSDILSANYNINEESDKDELGYSKLDLGEVTLRDVATKRKRPGAGLILDYQLPAGKLLYHGFISRLSEHQLAMSNALPVDQELLSAYVIERDINNTVMSQALQGEYRIGQMDLDFSLHQSISKQDRPGDLQLNVGTGHGLSIDSDLMIEEAYNATPNEYLSSVTVNNNKLAVNEMFNMKRDVVESERMAQGNLSIPYKFNNKLTGNIKFGFKYGVTERENDETHYVVAFESGSNGYEFMQMLPELWPELGVDASDWEEYFKATHFEDPDYDEGNYLSGKEAVDGLFWTGSFDKLRHLDNLAENQDIYVMDGLASTSRRFDMTETLTAFYISTELNIGRRITLQPGVRYESFKTDYLAYKGIQTGWRVWDYFSEPVTSTRKKEHWFPQIHLRVKPFDWFDIRLASTRSLIRPDYRAYSPYSYYAGASSEPSLQIGNININPSISENLDLYCSVYNNSIGLFTVGVFYKEIDNIITPLRFHTSDNEDIDNQYELGGVNTIVNTWVNVDDKPTIVRGFELDWQTNFWYLPSVFKGLVLNVNYTKLFSETVYPYDVFYKDPNNIFAPGVFVDSSRTARMPHQPDDVLNMTLGYDIGGFSARLSFLYQGDMLGTSGSDAVAGNIRGTTSQWSYSSIGIRPEKDSYTDEYYRWDLTIQQKLPWNGFQMYLNANNITNSVDQKSLSLLGKLKTREYYGRTFDIGIRYSF